MYRRLILLLAALAAPLAAQNTPVSPTLVSVVSGVNGQPATTQDVIYGVGYGCCKSASGDAYSNEALPSGQVETMSFYLGGTSYIDIQSFSFHGGTGSPLVLTFNFPNSDQLVLTDTSPTYNKNDGNGTARVTFGTGLFNGATGTLGYEAKCVDNCETKDGVLIAPNLAFQFAAGGSKGGTLYLPQPALGAEQVRVAVHLVDETNQAPATEGEADGHTIFKTQSPASGGNSGATGNIRTRAASASVPSFDMTVEPQPVPVNYTLSASCTPAANNCWVTVPTAGGTIPPFTSTTVSADFTFSGFPDGSYPANISLTLAPQTNPPQAPTALNYPVTLLVTPPAPSLQLAEDGITVRAAHGSSTSGSYPVTISNTGTAAMQFNVIPTTLNGGSWLTVSPPSGTVAPNSPETLSVVALTNGLDDGRYFGQLSFSANGADNSPQSMYVALEVTDGGPASVFPIGMNLALPPGIKFTTAVDMTNIDTQPVGAGISAQADQPTPWLSVLTSSYQLDAGAGASAPVTIDTTNLAPGFYNGMIDVLFSGNDGPNQIPVKVVVNPAIAPPPASANLRDHAVTACAPTQLVPVFTAMGNGFPVTVGLPAALDVQVKDDCGAMLTSGFVGVSLDNGDTPFSLTSIGNGHWTGTWKPHHFASASATITVTANSFEPPLQGAIAMTGALTANPNLPLVSTGGVVSAASLAANAPIAPGSYISIFGANLSATPAIAQSLPLSTSLGGVQVTLGGELLPLQYAGPNQINAFVPYDAPVNATAQLVVGQNNSAYSLPEMVLLTATQPAVFTQNASGTGAGAVQVITSAGAQFLNAPSAPATAGDALVIYCTGLGAVSPAVPAGTAAPSSTLSWTTGTVSVTLGGQPAHVLFSGLAPTYAGLYQVNAIVPAGIAPGSDVPVVLSVGGVSSPPVSVAIH